MGSFRRALRITFNASFKIVQYGCILHCATYGTNLCVCTGESMEPTIHDGDYYLSESISTWRQTLQRGDIVMVQSHTNPKRFICKRLMAMQNERVYNSLTGHVEVIPSGHVWLEGDNKTNSIDSREYGPLPYALIRGRLYLKILSSKKSRDR